MKHDVLTNTANENTVSGHRVVSTRACEDKAVVATERRNHDRDRHDRRARAGKDNVRGLGRDAVARRVLDRGKWKSSEISDVREQIKCDHEKGAERERKRNVAPRILH